MGGSCWCYGELCCDHWRELAQVRFLSRQKFCRDVTAKVLSGCHGKSFVGMSRQKFCRDVTAKVLSGCHGKSFVGMSRQKFCRDVTAKVLSGCHGKSFVGMSQQKFCRDVTAKVSLGQTHFCHNKSMFVMTKGLPQQKCVGRNKHVFIMTKCLLLQDVCHDKHVFVAVVATNHSGIDRE